MAYPNLRAILENEAVGATELIAELYALGATETAGKLSDALHEQESKQPSGTILCQFKVLTWEFGSRAGLQRSREGRESEGIAQPSLNNGPSPWGK